MHCVDTEVLEVVSDGKTAKGCWISPGHESCFIPDFDKIPGWKRGIRCPPDAPMVSSCEWAWSKYQVDFIRDADGEWKFWKMRLWPLYKTDFYVPWTQHPDMDPVDFPFHNHKPLPQPNWAWSMDAVYPPTSRSPRCPMSTMRTPSRPVGGLSVKEDSGMTEQETLELLTRKLERLEAVQACRNLMGKYSYYHTAFRNKEYIDLWAKREDDLLVMPWGSYQGFEGVKACYMKDHGDRSDPQVPDSLKGAVMMHEMDTEVIEVAEDGKTAKGAWLSPGQRDLCGRPGAGHEQGGVLRPGPRRVVLGQVRRGLHQGGQRGVEDLAHAPLPPCSSASTARAGWTPSSPLPRTTPL